MKKCEEHDDRFACPDTLVTFSRKLNKYGLIVHDGGSGWIEIMFCPWCGTLLRSEAK